MPIPPVAHIPRIETTIQPLIYEDILRLNLRHLSPNAQVQNTSVAAAQATVSSKKQVNTSEPNSNTIINQLGNNQFCPQETITPEGPRGSHDVSFSQRRTRQAWTGDIASSRLPKGLSLCENLPPPVEETYPERDTEKGMARLLAADDLEVGEISGKKRKRGDEFHESTKIKARRVCDSDDDIETERQYSRSLTPITNGHGVGHSSATMTQNGDEGRSHVSVKLKPNPSLNSKASTIRETTALVHAFLRLGGRESARSAKHPVPTSPPQLLSRYLVFEWKNALVAVDYVFSRGKWDNNEAQKLQEVLVAIEVHKAELSKQLLRETGLAAELLKVTSNDHYIPRVRAQAQRVYDFWKKRNVV
ncbi:hypothetical protein H0H81_003914 [Sphagnurus paluster]|uniref:Uncharacterized protein n=1 Tax=Sphagnurus paluster TaxID=117069 RepID=A0A9P7K5F2_9AGAR|nr:hypothetical protein H0H81_003914 [Sphagnurus paluster]